MQILNSTLLRRSCFILRRVPVVGLERRTIFSYAVFYFITVQNNHKMKTYYFIIGLVSLYLLSLSGCELNNQKKAESLVKKYLDTSLNDPSSYQSISFTELKKATGGLLEIQHTYRAKNGFGAFIKTSQWFEVDTAFKFCFIESYHFSDLDTIKTADTSRLDTSKINKK